MENAPIFETSKDLKHYIRHYDGGPGSLQHIQRLLSDNFALVDTRVLSAVAEHAEQLGEIDEAIIWFEKAYKEAADNIYAIQGFARIYKLLKRDDLRIPYLEQTHLLRPNDKINLQELGTASLKLGDVEKAFHWFHKILELDKNDYRALDSLGWVCFQKQDYSNALIYFSKAFRVTEKNMPTLFGIGQTFFALGDYNRGKKFLVQVLQKEPKNIIVLNILGRACLLNGDRENAAEYLYTAISLDPNNDRVLENLGRLAVAFENIIKANYFFEQALIVNPNNVHALEGLARIALTSNKYDSAKIYFEKGLLLQPDNMILMNGLAATALKLKDYKTIENMNEQMSRIHQESPSEYTHKNLSLLCTICFFACLRLNKGTQSLEKAHSFAKRAWKYRAIPENLELFRILYSLNYAPVQLDLEKANALIDKKTSKDGSIEKVDLNKMIKDPIAYLAQRLAGLHSTAFYTAIQEQFVSPINGLTYNVANNKPNRRQRGLESYNS